MGRHSRGAADSGPPAVQSPPEPPVRHPYAPRSVEDSGVWDRSTYRVVDVGLPPESPVAFPLGGSQTQAAGPNRAAARTPEAPRTADPAGGRTPLRAVPEVDRGRRRESRYGATRADLAGMTDLRYGATREPGAPRYGAAREPGGTGEPVAPREPVALREPGATREPGAARHGATRADLAEPARSGALREPGAARHGATRADLAEPRPEPVRYAAPEPRGTERHGATRADLAASVGATALAPRPHPRSDPDEVTDTGARRARSTFHLAPEADAGPEAEEDSGYADEPGLLLQWGIFVAQTLTGAVAGLGVWLGFYRLWSTYPLYAAPSVGATTILMLVLARTLRRRHGHDLDLMTAIVTIAVATVLTVLPAAFTLQRLAS